MAFDEGLAQRIREHLVTRNDVNEKKMFGGVGFLLKGNMCVGVWKQSLVVRVGPDAYESALREAGVRQFDITGRAMTGWVLVGPSAIDTDDPLRDWIGRAIKFVAKLPAK